jgi:hypothetical protein
VAKIEINTIASMNPAVPATIALTMIKIGKLRNSAVFARRPKSSYACRGRCSFHFRKVGGRFCTKKSIA